MTIVSLDPGLLIMKWLRSQLVLSLSFFLFVAVENNNRWAEYWPKWEQFQLPSFKSTRVWSHRPLFVQKRKQILPIPLSFFQLPLFTWVTQSQKERERERESLSPHSLLLSPFLASLVQAWNWLNHQWACEKKDWPGLWERAVKRAEERKELLAHVKA